MQQDYEMAAEMDIEYAQIEKIAQTAHSANRTWSHIHGDFSQGPWIEQSAEYRRMMRHGVLAQLKDPERSPEENHNAWKQAVEADGWTWGPKRDEALRKNPAIVPWEDLPVEQRRKNAMFQAIVGALDPRK